MSWVYIRSRGEPLWTVGHYDPQDRWQPDSDHASEEKAAERCHYLNGGNADLLQAIYEKLDRLVAIQQGAIL
jgi:hypothetical protein